MTSKVILAALAKRHLGAGWAWFPELRAGTGYGEKAERRVDAWAINLYPSSLLRRVSYEIKVSRSDFLAELKQPRKRAHALRISNEFYFATPVGLVRPEEIPPECGLIEVREHEEIGTAPLTRLFEDDNGTCRVVVPAPWRETLPPTWLFIASLARRVAKEAPTLTPDERTERE